LSIPRIVFAGTPEFACASLSALLETGLKPIAVYTQPDRPAGRGRQTTASPVKKFADDAGIPVKQPETLRSDAAVEELSSLRPDIMIVAAYGLLLPQNILDIPTQGCLNVHASLLPRWRGAAPIQAAILADDANTGVCLMQMTAGLDCGPVFSSRSVLIDDDESAGELHDRLAALGAELLVNDLDAVLKGTILPIEQDQATATYAKKIQKQDAEIDWSLPADDLHRHVRAYNPAPGAFFFGAASLRIKVWKSEYVAGIEAEPGTFVQYDSSGIVVACGQGGLRLSELQLPGKRRAQFREFISQIDLR
jgi:methionyl-tRNA formyltransferase